MHLAWAVAMAQQDSTAGPTAPNKVFMRLMQMDFAKYADRPVKIFFKDLGFSYDKYIPSEKRPGYINRVIFKYGDSISVDIAVKDLGQKEPLGFHYLFDVKVFDSKKVNWICLRYAGTCVKGCEQEDCH